MASSPKAGKDAKEDKLALLRPCTKNADRVLRTFRAMRHSIGVFIENEELCDLIEKSLINLLDILCIPRFVSEDLAPKLIECNEYLVACTRFLLIFGESETWATPEFVRTVRENTPALTHRLELMSRVLHLAQHPLTFTILEESEEHKRVALEEAAEKARLEEEAAKAASAAAVAPEELPPMVLTSFAFSKVVPSDDFQPGSRQKEFEVLQSEFAKLDANRPRVVFLIGNSGVGVTDYAKFVFSRLCDSKFFRASFEMHRFSEVVAKTTKPAEAAHLEGLPELRENGERIMKALLAPLQLQSFRGRDYMLPTADIRSVYLTQLWEKQGCYLLTRVEDSDQTHIYNLFKQQTGHCVFIIASQTPLKELQRVLSNSYTQTLLPLDNQSSIHSFMKISEKFPRDPTGSTEPGKMMQLAGLSGGFPLALKLLAHQVGVARPAPAMVQDLEGKPSAAEQKILKLFEKSARPKPIMRALTYAFTHLTNDVADVLLKLHIFPGTFDFEALSRIIGDGQTIDALHKSMDALVRRGLVDSFLTNPLPSVSEESEDMKLDAPVTRVSNVGVAERTRAPVRKSAIDYGKTLKMYAAARYQLHPIVREFAHLVASQGHDEKWFLHLQLKFLSHFAGECEDWDRHYLRTYASSTATALCTDPEAKKQLSDKLKGRKGKAKVPAAKPSPAAAIAASAAAGDRKAQLVRMNSDLDVGEEDEDFDEDEARDSVAEMKAVLTQEQVLERDHVSILYRFDLEAHNVLAALRFAYSLTFSNPSQATSGVINMLQPKSLYNIRFPAAVLVLIYKRFLELVKEQSEDQLRAQGLSALAEVYRSCGLFDKAIEAARETLGLAEKHARVSISLAVLAERKLSLRQRSLSRGSAAALPQIIADGGDGWDSEVVDKSQPPPSPVQHPYCAPSSDGVASKSDAKDAAGGGGKEKDATASPKTEPEKLETRTSSGSNAADSAWLDNLGLGGRRSLSLKSRSGTLVSRAAEAHHRTTYNISTIMDPITKQSPSSLAVRHQREAELVQAWMRVACIYETQAAGAMQIATGSSSTLTTDSSASVAPKKGDKESKSSSPAAPVFNLGMESVQFIAQAIECYEKALAILQPPATPDPYVPASPAAAAAAAASGGTTNTPPAGAGHLKNKPSSGVAAATKFSSEPMSSQGHHRRGPSQSLPAAAPTPHDHSVPGSSATLSASAAANASAAAPPTPQEIKRARLLGHVLNCLGLLYTQIGAYQNGVSMHSQCQALKVTPLNQLGQAANAMQRKASSHLTIAHGSPATRESSASVADVLPEQHVLLREESRALAGLGDIFLRLGDWRRAIECFKQGRSQLEVLGRRTTKSDSAAAAPSESKDSADSKGDGKSGEAAKGDEDDQGTEAADVLWLGRCLHGLDVAHERMGLFFKAHCYRESLEVLIARAGNSLPLLRRVARTMGPPV